MLGIAKLECTVDQIEYLVAGCTAGVFVATIAADIANIPRYRMDLGIGNIKDRTFRDLWA